MGHLFNSDICVQNNYYKNCIIQMTLAIVQNLERKQNFIKNRS